MVELLVVIAVIAILTGLILAGLSSGKESVKRTQCLNQLRQVGMSARMYWDENRGRPFPFRGAATNNGDLYWFGWLERGSEGSRQFDRKAGYLAPYLTAALEICPAFDYRNLKTKLKATGVSFGFGYNLHLSQLPTAVEQVRTPSAKVSFGDAAQVNDFQPPASPSNPLLEEFYYLSTAEPTAHFRHRARANAAFMDGHVAGEKMAPGTLDPRLPEVKVGKLEAEKLVVP